MDNMTEVFEWFIASYWGPLILLLAAIAFAGICSIKVKTTFAKYDRVRSSRGQPAHVIARQILDSNGLYDVDVQPTRGHLTDHYDPRTNVVRLSEATYNSVSVGAIGIAAHECGHALQYAHVYTPIRIRAAIFPVVNIANRTWMFIVLLGMFMYLPFMINVGIIAFGSAVVFQLVTLPVEFDASNRALDTLEAHGILDHAELKGAHKILSAAAMTYVAALMVSIAQFIRILAIARGGRRR
jgi:hypothetical protein